jgi:hypothetical protein
VIFSKWERDAAELTKLITQMKHTWSIRGHSSWVSWQVEAGMTTWQRIQKSRTNTRYKLLLHVLQYITENHVGRVRVYRDSCRWCTRERETHRSSRIHKSRTNTRYKFSFTFYLSTLQRFMYLVGRGRGSLQGLLWMMYSGVQEKKRPTGHRIQVVESEINTKWNQK